MSDREAIIELLGRAGWAFDTQNIDVLCHSYTDDGQFHLQIQQGDLIRFDGLGVVRAMYEEAMAAQRSQGDQRRHIVTNFFFGDETPSSALATSYLLLMSISKDQIRVVTTGIYTDTVVKDSGRWRIRHRHLYLDLPPI